ncbi:hypothetical protein EVAR_92387_1 [Eumeta japonica]|uniref:Uncharacterized protein n=1 Tax=Eumeta variegata TaxID=151549 RepID=A0A4C1TLY8_EUMVA|nr:hypothetical protein EVAR_92387_1 [Eumeta japonica]
MTFAALRKRQRRPYTSATLIRPSLIPNSLNESQHEKWRPQQAACISLRKDITIRVQGFSGFSIAAVPIHGPLTRNFKVPWFDGTSSWSAYKLQFEIVMRTNSWNQEQTQTALTLSLHYDALMVLEALEEQRTYKKLLKTLEACYGLHGYGHLEYAYRAQSKDRAVRLQHPTAFKDIVVNAFEAKVVRDVHPSTENPENNSTRGKQQKNLSPAVLLLSHL